MTENDWEGVVDIVQDLLERLDEASTELCERRYFKACIVINEKLVPELKGLLSEARARAKMEELAGEEEEEGLEALIIPAREEEEEEET